MLIQQSLKADKAMSSSTQKAKISAKEIAVFAMLGALMFCGDVLLEALPNIHLVGVLTVVYTLVFRKKALIPIYLYVLLTIVLNGFNGWTMPYLYIWTILWGLVMLLPKRMPIWLQWIVYPSVCSLHGLGFGVLYAPAHAIMFGTNFEATVAWIASGFYFDVVHAIGNLAGGLLIIPLKNFLIKLCKKAKI